MIRLYLTLIIAAIFLPFNAFGYTIDLSEPDYFQYNETVLHWMPPGAGGPEGFYYEDYDGNAGGNYGFSCMVIPEAGDYTHAIATVSVTVAIDDSIGISSSNFGPLDIGYQPPYVGDNYITEIFTVQVGTQSDWYYDIPTLTHGDTTGYDFGAYFTSYPDPIDASDYATAALFSSWEFETTAEILSITPIFWPFPYPVFKPSYQVMAPLSASTLEASTSGVALSTTPAPEPSTILLMTSSLLSILGICRKRLKL